MKPKTIFGIVLLVGFGSMLFMNFGQHVGGYMDFAEAERTGSKAHVVGYWVEDGKTGYDPQRNVFQFQMKDEMGKVQRVHYYNPMPANFEDAEKLVINGQLQGDVFVAEHILVKCPSKYNDARGLQEVPNPTS